MNTHKHKIGTFPFLLIENKYISKDWVSKYQCSYDKNKFQKFHTNHTQSEKSDGYFLFMKIDVWIPRFVIDK